MMGMGIKGVSFVSGNDSDTIISGSGSDTCGWSWVQIPPEAATFSFNTDCFG